jgi:four helix bundle protein
VDKAERVHQLSGKSKYPISNFQCSIFNERGENRDIDTKQYDLEDRLINFSIAIIEVVEALPNTKVGNHIAGQLVRSGTSPAPNYGEAQSAESRKDFIHKMKIALKELRETRIWLIIIHRKSLIKPANKVDPVLMECQELIRIFAKSIATAESRKKK